MGPFSHRDFRLLFSAQIVALLEGDVWLDNARKANATAARLADRG